MWSRRTPKFGPVAEGRKAGRLSSETETGAEWGRGTGGGFWSGYLREAWWAPQVILDKVGGWRGGGAGQAGPPSTFRQGGTALGRQELAVVTASPPEDWGPPPPRGPEPRPLRPGPARREHHDRVLHDGADAGLSRGLLRLQPHAGRPPELPAPLCRQRLLPRRPLSPAQGGPPGPLPTPACSAWAPSRLPVPKPPSPGAPAPGLRPALGGLDALPRMRLCLMPALTPGPCLPGPALWGHSQPSWLRRADHQPVSPPGSALRAPRP